MNQQIWVWMMKRRSRTGHPDSPEQEAGVNHLAGYLKNRYTIHTVNRQTSQRKVQTNNRGNPLIREYLQCVKNTRQIRCIHDLNADILHIPDIRTVHLF